jgi:hypothetical protein
MIAEELQVAGLVCREQPLQEQPAEQARQHAHRQEEAGAARHPALAIERDAAARHDHVDVRMMGERTNVVAVVSPVSAQGFNGGGFKVGLGPFASGGGRTCTDDTASTNFLTRTGGSAPNYGAGSGRYADAICTFIKALETAGLITGNLTGVAGCSTFTGGTGGFDGIWLMKAHTSANAVFNICGTGFSLVNNGTSFSADAGYTGASSSCVDTQINPAAGTGKYLQSDASVWVHTSTNFVSGTDYGSMLGNGSGSLIDRLYPHYLNDTFYSAINQSSLELNPGTTGHFFGATRGPTSGSVQMSDYIDTTGDTGNPVAWPSVTPVGPTIVLLADSNTGHQPISGYGDLCRSWWGLE